MYRLPHSLGGDGCSSRDTPSPHGRGYGAKKLTLQDNTTMYSSSPTWNQSDTRYWDQSLARHIWTGRRFAERGDVAYARCLICDVMTVCARTAEGFLCTGKCYDNIGDMRCTVRELNCLGSSCYCCDYAEKKEQKSKEQGRLGRYTPTEDKYESHTANTGLVQEE